MRRTKRRNEVEVEGSGGGGEDAVGDSVWTTA